jgi:hypothetical protein
MLEPQGGTRSRDGGVQAGMLIIKASLTALGDRPAPEPRLGLLQLLPDRAPRAVRRLMIIDVCRDDTSMEREQAPPLIKP